jgi:peroxin-12
VPCACATPPVSMHVYLRHWLLQVVEWWYTAGEEKVEEARRNVPPPPPAYPPHPGGMPLIADASVCPICHRKRVAPAQLATSGYVFCYKCIYTIVATHGRCPVTHIRASLDDIRRLFLSAK